MPTLNWIGKDKVVNHATAVPFHVLEHKYNFGGESENKIIYGDNLLALKSLLPEYEGRIKCIYIDPPYNTGNEGWIYNDKVNSPQIKKWLGEVVGREGEDLSRHDKWLCMMYPRLKLLKKLLADDGAIFISIDDNEQANLKLICDEIFGAQNFIASLPWQSRQSLQNDTDLSINHEFIVVYAKKRRMKDRRLKTSNSNRWHTIKEFAFNPLPIDATKFSNPDNDSRGAWKADPFDAPNVRPNLTYPITNPNTRKIFLPPKGRCWRVEPEKFAALLADGRIIFGKTGKAKPQLKVFLSEQQELGSVPNSWFDADECGTATEATKLLQTIFGDKNIFDTPKPPRLVEKILQLATDKNSIVLDSFAGSGTTAHAVLNLNAQDGGNRKFILVEMEDYAETITAERVRRVIQGYGQVAGTGGSFDFYEVGEPLMIHGNLNENIDIEKIHAYIWYTETLTQYKKPSNGNPAYLGDFNDTAIYFHYNHDQRTILDSAFLRTIERKANNYLIYADECGLDEDFMLRNSITFKKIPRDIKCLWSDVL
ncbi:MAG: site-specific DNA-methyltransferase [Paludibacteraceae bacterium]|nr:site-specific DNA-methyltransferase [Paludibacteraceae bacterium]